MAYHIFRTEKLKHMGNVGASGAHMMRNIPTPNADPSVKNTILVGTSDPAGDVSLKLPKVGDRDANGKLLRTAQSVLAIEIMASASPEWWETATPDMQEDWVRESTKAILDWFGEDNVAHLQLHNDEKSPHLTGMVVPLDDNGRLNAKQWTGYRTNMAKMQTHMHKAVQHLGLKRGVEGSKAKHEAVKRHYGAIKRKVRPIKIDAPTLRDFLSPSTYAEKQRKKAIKQASALYARAKTTESALSTAKGTQATNESLSRRNTQLEKDLAAERRKSAAAELRQLPLVDVADALGLIQDPKDKSIWRSSTGMKIGFGTGESEGKFYDNSAQKGGGGAIDLAMHAMATDYKGALSWLAANFGVDATGQDAALRVVNKAKRDVSLAQKERPAFTPPEPVPANWGRVRDYLISERKLPADVVDKLHDTGDVYADDRRNAVFVSRAPDGTPTGAELKGTAQGSKFTGMAPGSMKANGSFRVGKLHSKVIYFVESAIDAISLWVLRKDKGDKSLAVVSCAGSAPTLPVGITSVIPDYVRKVNAYDADAPGDKAADAMGIDRLRPEIEGSDWNKILTTEDDRGVSSNTSDTSPAGPKL